MNRFSITLASIAAAAVLLLALPSCAQTLTLFRFGNGVYDYELTAPAGGTITLAPGTAIVLSGLSGVTGATVSGGLTNGGADPEGCGLRLVWFTSTKVALIQPNGLSVCVFAAPSLQPGQFPTLEVTAAVHDSRDRQIHALRGGRQRNRDNPRAVPLRRNARGA